MLKWLLVVFAATAIKSNAQSAIANQVRAILKDTADFFISFRGNPDTITTTVKGNQFFSNMVLEGTRSNKISFEKDTSGLYQLETGSYTVVIEDSVSRRKGFKTTDEWKDRMQFLTGEGFQISQVTRNNYQPAEYGYIFNKGDASVSIYLFQRDKSPHQYFVVLGVWQIKAQFIR